MLNTNFPILDFSRMSTDSSDQLKVLGREVDAICQQTGFLAIRNHGVDQSTIDNLWKAAEQFFDLPISEKQKVAPEKPGMPYGWFGPNTEALAKSRNVDTPPDLKESFNGGPPRAVNPELPAEAFDFFRATPVVENPPDFVNTWQQYYLAMENLAERVMSLFAISLNLPADWFSEMINEPISALRALNYPHTNTKPEPGQLRAGAHSDYGSLTILLPQAGSSGLEILNPQGQWQAVPALADTFVINIGDLMARWTNDRWVSTLHRVVNPCDSEDFNPDIVSRRQSMAFFHQPNWLAEISSIPSCVSVDKPSRYEPVLSGPWLAERFRSTVEKS